MCSKEVKKLKTILSINNCNERLGKIFQTRDKYFFYDLGTGKIFECTFEEYKIFEKILSSKDNNELEKMFKSSDINVLSELLDSIEKENLLQAHPFLGFTGDQVLNLEENLNRKLNQIILEVTQKCNLRCKYCIYGDENEKFRSFNETKDMPLEVALKSIDSILNRVDDEFYITFYGGEPLINFRLIKEVVEYVLSLKLNTKLNFSMTTNLTLMSKDIAKFIANTENFSVVCSIDGDRLTHDEYRVDINGKGSFDRTLKGLEILYNELKKKGKEDLILLSTVITPPYDENKLSRIQSFFRDCPYIDEKTSIITSYVDYGKKIDIDDLRNRLAYKSSIEFMKDNNPVQEWSENFIEDFNSENPFTWNGILQNLQKIHSRRISGEPMSEYIMNGCCMPGGRKLFVTVDGKYNLCERMGETPNIGNYIEGYDVDSIKKYYVSDYCKKSENDCSRCWAINLCSICYAVCYDKYGLNLLTKKYKCASERFGIENYLRLYHEMMYSNPSVIEDLNKMQLF